MSKKTALATLAGGCFWGMEELFRLQAGVVSTRVGYTGGNFPNPRYEDVKTGKTGHAEALQVVFDSNQTSYEALLLYFFRIHNPTTEESQGNDIGSQYRSAIFYRNADEQAIALNVIARVNGSGKWNSEVVTEVLPLSDFWPAEDYHQRYLEKNPRGYTCHFERDFTF